MKKEMKIPEIRERFQDEWVVVSITKRDKYNVPEAGVVIFHSTDEDEVYDVGLDYHRKNPKADIYFFYTGDLVPQNMGVMLGAR